MVVNVTGSRHCNSLKERDKVKVQANENNLELTDEEIRTWKNNNERIQVVGVRSIKPVKVL
jgi:hypothetical protein